MIYTESFVKTEEIVPSFFESMRRIINGQPVFEDEDQKTPEPTQSKPNEQPVDTGPTIKKGSEGTFPVVYVKRVDTRFNGKNMDVYCRILNTWPEEVMLDKIRLLGTTRELDDYIPGGQEKEFLVYSGPKTQKQYFEAFLDYKTKEEGDYFESVHDVTSTYHSEDKTYSISDMRLRKPIRDIYE